MSRVTADLNFQTLLECHYCYPEDVLDDVKDVSADFPNLQLYVDYYLYPNNDKKKLVYLGGTVPVTYEGSKYNIPVCIWIHETHPKNPPRCYVCPSPSMVINAKSSNVDAHGRVLLHCLNNWKIGWSNLSIVLEEMIAAFQRETPLFATYPVQNPSPHSQAKHLPAELVVQPNPVSSYGSWPNTGSSSMQKSQHGASSSSVPQHASNILPKGTKSQINLNQASETEMSGVRRSYTQELLDFGITFGAQALESNHQTNPFISPASAPTNSTSNVDDIDDMFKSLQLQRVVNMYQFSNREKDVLHAGGAWQDWGGSPRVHPGLVDNHHKVVVSRLPVGVSPTKMKNKLTIYFQRKQNAGGEVLDVKYPAAQPDQAWVLFRNQRDAEHVLRQPDRVITINEQRFLIQLKKFEDMEIPDGVQGEKAEMFKSILSLEGCSFSSTDVLEAVQSCRDLPSALKYLCHDCPICQEQVSFNRMVTMTHCSCTFCESCFKKYFSSVIKEKNIVHAVCPLCNLPDVRGGRREDSMEYFSLLDTQIRYYLDPQIHELFQRKLRDQALQEMPNFRWCAHCCFGLLHEADRLRMDCPSCGKSTCFKCKRPWASQHEGISCEKFKEWEQLNSPEYQNSRLEQLLSRNKIDCPKCKFRFFLARGGCLHFRCTQCQHEFCGGCSQPFKQGSACNFSIECTAKGLHAHHPRNCLYHLRDWSVLRLRTLLQHYGISHPLMFSPKDSVRKQSKGICGVMEFQETGAVKEEPCGRQAFPEYNGYCTLHYKECLVELINNNALDPVVLLDGTELRAEMNRWKVPVPDKQPVEPDQRYEDRLRQILKERVGLTSGAALGLKTAAPPTPSPSSPPAAEAPWYSILNRAVPEDSQQLLLLTD
ncbi:uncharacterized protein si:dkey-181m9.8 [Megalobrama amblycephala]|uniref:uncharacterized protein si:dkey-181m9.8 n=1 Tax=Megalobrama amblycephala TaxID=75352 RepID=UPI002013CA49|nr:uncharacterized protein si:dkey-181m9.8 [Megalobrama amblycephala]